MEGSPKNIFIYVEYREHNITHTHTCTHTYTHTQEGNHRVHALKELVLEEPVLRFLETKNGAEYMVPVNIYTEAMPVDLCMRYGRLMNELQAVCKKANFLDDARFVQNIFANLPEVTTLFAHHLLTSTTNATTHTCKDKYTHTTQGQNSHLMLKKALFAGMEKALAGFEVTGKRQLTESWTGNLLRMRTALGSKAFLYAEQLQAVNFDELAAALHEVDDHLIKTVGGKLPDYSEVECFITTSQYMIKKAWQLFRGLGVNTVNTGMRYYLYSVCVYVSVYACLPFIFVLHDYTLTNIHRCTRHGYAHFRCHVGALRGFRGADDEATIQPGV